MYVEYGICAGSMYNIAVVFDGYTTSVCRLLDLSLSLYI